MLSLNHAAADAFAALAVLESIVRAYAGEPAREEQRNGIRW